MAYNAIMKFFEWGHLKGDKQRQTSQKVAELATWADQNIMDNAEKSAGLRKLLEAKDCFVRATLEE